MNNLTISESGVISDETFADVAAAAPQLGVGVSRQAYACGDVVLKLARGGDYAEANRNANRAEANFWERISQTPAAGLFARVYACAEDGRWLVMERVGATLHKVPNGYALQQKWTDAANRLNRELRLGLPLADTHMGNLGVTADGRVVALDYAW